MVIIRIRWITFLSWPIQKGHLAVKTKSRFIAMDFCLKKKQPNLIKLNTSICGMVPVFGFAYRVLTWSYLKLWLSVSC